MTTQQQNLEKYGFLWSEIRLIIAALALFLGGIPPLTYVLPIYTLANAILTICWIISGVASGYLFYLWYKNGFVIFGGKNRLDIASFLVCVISGINLGLAGIIKQNIGMSISSNHVIFFIVGIVYLFSAYHLLSRWKTHGKKLF